MKRAKEFVFKLLSYFRVYPHIFFTFNAFKIYEFKELIRGISFSKDEVILDIGCGSGLQAMLIGKKCKKVIGIDISEKVVSAAQLRAQCVKGTVNSEFRCIELKNAGFEDEYFDKIFSVCVIEHIPNYVEILKEAYRILKKDGQMIFSVDALETIKDKKLIEKHKKEHFVYKYFRREELRTILEEIGFKEVNIYPIFKSDFAKKRFIKRFCNRTIYNYLRRRFKYGYPTSILAYFILRYNEYHCAEKNEGLFLIAKCSK